MEESGPEELAHRAVELLDTVDVQESRHGRVDETSL